MLAPIAAKSNQCRLFLHLENNIIMDVSKKSSLVFNSILLGSEEGINIYLHKGV